MKKRILQFTIVCALIVGVGMASISMVNAQQQVICRGDRDWGTFISSTISYDDFSEYWEDILVRYNSNICHYTDIDGLLNRITKVRKQIRNAFYACADTTRMKNTYYEIEAELFFLRNYIDADKGQFLVTADDKMIAELRDNFVINNRYFNDDEILALFEGFKIRYEPRLETYKNCKDPSWGALVDKWNEFKENAGGIGSALAQAKKSASKKWEQMANTSLNLNRDFFGGFVDAKINGLPLEEGVDQIVQELKENLPEGFTFEQYQAAEAKKSQNYKYLALEAEYLSEYRGLYAETSDEYTSLIIDKLVFLQRIIQDTFPYQNQTIQCVKSIGDKQC